MKLIEADQGLGEEHLTENELLEYSLSTLAWVGDAVFELYVRTRLSRLHQTASGPLHRIATRFVSARGQAAFTDRLLKGDEAFPLEENETIILRRARNYHPQSMAKHADQADYRKATAFEALIGWLWLQGKNSRVTALIDCALDQWNPTEENHG